MLHERYKKLCVVVDGRVTGRKRHAAIKQFQSDKHTRMIISQSKVAIGWNATAADTVAFVELDNVPVIMEQAFDRIHRIGQTKKCNAYFFVARDTIEERYIQKAREIMQRFNAVLDGGDVGEDYSAFDAVIQDLRTKARSRRKKR
jgi:SNF2 family DNA or RNA helicase